MPQMIRESGARIASVAASADVSGGDAARLVAACRDADDELIADDYSIVASPLLYATASDPVFAALIAS